MRRTRPCERCLPPHCSISTGLPGAHPDGVGRQQIGDDLEPLRIADLEQRLAGRHHRLAFAQPLEHDAVHRRDDVDRRPPAGGGVCSRARASCSSCSAARHGKLGGPQRLLGGLQRRLARLRARRATIAPASDQLLLAPERRRARVRARRRRVRARPAPAPPPRARPRRPRVELAARARIEQRRRRPAPAAPRRSGRGRPDRPARARCAAGGRPPAPRRRTVRARASRRLRRWSPASARASTRARSTASRLGPQRRRGNRRHDEHDAPSEPCDASESPHGPIPGPSARPPGRADPAGAARCSADTSAAPMIPRNAHATAWRRDVERKPVHLALRAYCTMAAARP